MPSQLPFPDFHSEVNRVSRSLYESGHFTDALRSASIRLEECCKQILKNKTGKEETGTTLMAKLFCEKDWKVLYPIINMWLQDSADKQKSYYFLFSWFAWAIRNQLAHSTEPLDDIEALYWLNVVSYLFYKLDRAKEMNTLTVMPTDQRSSSIQDIPVNDTVESGIKSLLLWETRITDIVQQTQDPALAKLTIKKVSEEILSEKIDVIWERSYNYYFKYKDTIVLFIYSSLYGHN